MSTPEQSNAVHQNDDLDQGPLAHHHTLGFSSSQAAPGNYAYKLVVQDEGTAVTTNPSVINFAGASVAVTTVGSVVTVTVSGSGSGGGTWYSGAGTPSSGTGANGDFYLNTNNGDVYQKVSGTWTYIGSVKASEQLHVYVKNNAGVAITKGQAVYVSGADGTNILVKLAQANAESTSSQTLGLAESNIAINGFGYIAVFGLLSNIDTSAGAAGDPVWLSGTTAGGLLFGIANKPVAPTHLVYIGTVTKANPSTGEIFIREQNGYELDELHDVSITSKTNGDLIQYESSSGLWKNKAQSTLTIAESQVTNLVSDLAGKSSTSHTHSEFIPAGGTAGQVLSKIDATNYNTQWTTPSAGGGGSNPLIDTWVYSNVTTIANPTAGYFRLNSLVGSSVTKLACSYQSSSGTNQSELLEKLKAGDSVFFTPSSTLTGSKWWRGTITSKTRNYVTPISQRAFISQVYNTNDGFTTVSSTLASTAFNAGDLIIVNVAMYSDIVPTINTPTCTGLTFTLLQTQTQPSTTTRVSTYYAYTSTALSARQITVSGTGGSVYIGIVGEAPIVTGADSASPFGSIATASSTGSTLSLTTSAITTADSNNSLLYGFFWEASGSSSTIGSTDMTLNSYLNLGLRGGYKSVPKKGTSSTLNINSTANATNTYSWLYSEFEVKAAQESYWTFDISNPTLGYSLPTALDVCSLMFITEAAPLIYTYDVPGGEYGAVPSTAIGNIDDYTISTQGTSVNSISFPWTISRKVLDTSSNPTWSKTVFPFQGFIPTLSYDQFAPPVGAGTHLLRHVDSNTPCSSPWYGLKDPVTVVSKELNSTTNIATITTKTAHGLNAGSYVRIAGVDSFFNGNFFIASVPSTTTFTYFKTGGAGMIYTQPATGTVYFDKIETQSLSSTIYRSIYSGDNNLYIAKGTASYTPYNEAFFFATGEVLTLPLDIDTYTMTYSSTTTAADPGTSSIRFNSTNASTITNIYIAERLTPNYTITTKALTSNIATLTTNTNHTYVVGDYVRVEGVDATFNGSYTVVGVTSNTFSYSKVNANVTSTAATGTVYKDALYNYLTSSNSNNIYTRASYVVVTQANDATKFVRLRLTPYSSYTQQSGGTWAILTCTFVQVGSGGLPTNAASCNVSFEFVGRILLGNGGNAYGYGVNVDGYGKFSLGGMQDQGNFESKGNTFWISNTSLTGNVATITTSEAHGFSVGDRVSIANATNTTYNGKYTIASVPTTTTFTYSLTNANIASASSIGTACNGAIATDIISCSKFGKAFYAYLLDPTNSVIYALPSNNKPRVINKLIGFDSLLGLQGFQYKSTSRTGVIYNITFNC
jgi:hypothetical protein